MNDDTGTEASGHRSVGVGVNHGIVSTGDGAMIDARTVHLPAEAVREPADVAVRQRLHNLPAPHSPVFVDRHEHMADLGVAINLEPPAAFPVLHGLGGTGKTTLALHFAHANGDHYNPIWWISADSPSSVTGGLAELAARLNPYAPPTSTSAERADWAIRWLQTHRGWLLVFDNATSPHDLEPVLGMLTTGRHLITSRRATGWRHLAKPMPLSTLPPDASVDMLMRMVGPDDSDPSALDRLAAELGHLPLALDQASAYMESTAITPTAYLDRLRRYPARMFATSAPDRATGEADSQRTIARIWQLSLRAITDEDPLAGDILRALAWLAPAPIPRELAYELHDDPFVVDSALAALHSYSMITLTRHTLSIHRLVQAVARIPDPAAPDRSTEAIAQSREHATRILQKSLPENPLFDVSGWPRWRELLPHVLTLADVIDSAQSTPATAHILLAASGFLQGDGQFTLAITLAQRAVDAYLRLHGGDAEATLTARSFLASAYRAAGDLATATPLHRQNLADCERVFGADHPETLVARGNLAYLYGLQDQPADALELHRRNMIDYERVHGPDHPHALNARANLAASYRALGDLPKAIGLHRQSVIDYTRVYGADHPETVTTRSNLAYAYQLADDFARAVPLFQQVLADREALFGPGHLLTEQARQLLAGAQQAACAYESGKGPGAAG